MTSTNAVEELAVLVEEIYYPLLNNKTNQQSWPEELRKDIEKKVQYLRDVVCEAKGNLLQITVLPMPVALDNLHLEILEDGGIELGDMRNSIESIVNRWCTLITNEVMERNELHKTRPELSGRQLTPDMEFEFWRMRNENLQSIYDQLQQEKCQTATRLLERVQSVYTNSFRTTFCRLVVALEDARDITLWLKPLVGGNSNT